MRVLFFSTSQHWSASSRAFATAARGLAARGDTVTVACRAGTSTLQGYEHFGLETVGLPPATSVSADSWRLRTVLRGHGTEAVFVHTEREQLSASSAMRLAARGAIIRRVPAGSIPRRGRYSTWASRLADERLLFSTEADRARANANAQSFVAPLGVDVSRVEDARAESRRALGIADATQLMVCAVDHAPATRITTVMRALALLAERHPALRLVLVGRAADSDDTRMHAASLGVTSLVRVLGERVDMPSILAAADIGWVATDGDDGAFACLDFMAAGVPIIAERSPVVSLYVPDGIAGVHLPESDPGNTASTVARILRDEDKRRAMGAAGRTRARRDFGEAAMVDGFAAAASAAARPGRAS